MTAQERQELVAYLESDQLVAERSRSVARAHIGPHANAGLWVLGLFAIVVSAMVIYTFVAQLAG